ncbi:M48 family metalloprotease [Haloarcula sp. S1CR25-12]|uniref:M48 family metalloprotease n=1 Tax=Haloarcula saliterrae TaxID=2950534 RepID=A0ABU2FDD2_9EURY|nr:M48 family metalloprotease [Haloarcula sp. S1CR25-12]MDS0259953.1 M48 family metalloprotease [Haloarcula sp. S1CR25-12]
MNPGRRFVLATVGLGSLVVYLLVGVVAYRFLLLVWAQRPPTAVVVATVLGTALLFGVVSYWTGTARLKRSLDAVLLPRSRAPALYRRYDRLTDRMRAGEPSLLVARLPVPNAFAVGGPGGAIVVDRRLFALLSLDEMETLLAHELAHFERRDALVQTLGYSLTQSLVGLVGIALFPVIVVTGGIARALALLRGNPESWSRSWLGRAQRGALGAVALLGFAVTLLVLSYSRRREWAADDRAATVTGNPLALARALRKIERASTPDMGPLTPLYVHGTEDNPLSKLLSTHPPMGDRVARLKQMAGLEV